MTTDTVRSLLEAHGFTVDEQAEDKVVAQYRDITAHTFRSMSGWWAVAARDGISLDHSCRRVAAVENPDTYVMSLDSWIREWTREAAA